MAMKFTPQQVRAIRMSPKGQLPPFMSVAQRITGPGNGVGPKDTTVTGPSVGRVRIGKNVIGQFGQ